MIDYELALTSAALRDAEVFYHARSLRLDATSFTDEECSLVWDAMVENEASGIPHTPVEIWMRVQKDAPDKAKQVESTISLASMEAEDITQHRSWATAVAESARERDQKRVVEEFAGMVHDGADPVSAGQELIERFASIEDNYTLEDDRIERQRKAVVDRLKHRIMDGSGLVSTGIMQMDRDLGRLEDYEYTVLAARPGQGKSALARQVAMEFVRKHKQPVQLFSMEMGVDQVVKFMAAANCNISAKGIEDGFENDKATFMAECERFAGALGRFFYIHDECSDFDDIEHRILSGLRKHKPGLIIIDYLQLLSPRRTQGMNREQQIAYMSRRLKNITTVHRVPVIVLSQMSREYEKEEREPRKSDLRESGSLEQDADRIWFLHQDKRDEMEGTVTPMHLIQAKGRSTGEARMKVGFQKKFTKFLFDEVWRDKTVDTIKY